MFFKLLFHKSMSPVPVLYIIASVKRMKSLFCLHFVIFDTVIASYALSHHFSVETNCMLLLIENRLIVVWEQAMVMAE